MSLDGCTVNAQVPSEQQRLLEDAMGEEVPLFAVVSDLSLDGHRAVRVLAATQRGVYVTDDAGGVETHAYADIESVTVKRMYGSARVSVALRNGERVKLLRCSYAVCALCDAAAAFINSVSDGGDPQTEAEAVRAAYEKQLSVCPKCGRTLLHPGADCIKCQSKGKIVSKLVKYVIPQKKLLIICLIMSVIMTTLQLLPPYLTKVLVDTVLVEGNTSARDQLMLIVLTLFVSYIIIFTISGVRGYMLRVSGDKIVQQLRNDVYRRAQFLPMRFYDKTSTGSVINRISGDSNTIQAFVLKITQEVIVQFFLLIGITVIMLVLDWRLTLLSLIPVPFVVIGAKKFSQKIAPFYRRIWRRWSAVSSVLTDTIPCVRIIKAFAGEDRAVGKFEKYNDEWYKVDVKSAKITSTFPAIVSFVVTCGSLIIWGVGGNWVIDGLLTAGLLVSFLSYTSMFYTPVNFFAYLSDSYQGALAAAERILDILDAEPEPDLGKGNKPEDITGKIEFRGVSFSFDKTKKTLADINLTIEPGDIVGIVGTTGSGKSTLINLLMRFYDNYEGDILIDGINIRDIDIQYYRSKMGYVQQEPMMFSDTIFNNIAYGVPDAHVEEVIHAADIANAHEFIANQPDGYDSMLGERGVGLSGGEKQRISIARAVLKNPSILIFDEATAAVDSETENLIQQAIERLISGRTTLMIAHRLSTLRKANKIVVVDAGRIIECGTHEELMALEGKYYKLIQIQSMGSKTLAQL